MRQLSSSIGVLAIALAPARARAGYAQRRGAKDSRRSARRSTRTSPRSTTASTTRSPPPTNPSSTPTAFRRPSTPAARARRSRSQVHGTSNAFLSGPLELREGVTLVVDKGATLFETARSRRPGDRARKLRHRRHRSRAAASRSSPSTTSPAPASWATASSTAAAARRSSARTSARGTWASRPAPGGAQKVSPPHRLQPRRQLHPLPHHAQELPQLPRLL